MPRALEGLYFTLHHSLLTDSMTSCLIKLDRFLTMCMFRFLIYSCFCSVFCFTKQILFYFLFYFGLLYFSDQTDTLKHMIDPHMFFT